MAAGFSFCIQSSGIVVVDCAPCCPGADSSVGHGAFLQACICGITFFFFSKRAVRPVRLHVVSVSNHVVLVADRCGFTVRPWFRCPTLVWCPTCAASLSDLVLSLSDPGGFVAVIIRAPCETIAIGIATQGRTATPHRAGVGQLSDPVWCCCPTLCGDTTQGLTATPHRVGQQHHTGVGQLSGPSDPVVSLSGPVVKCHCCSLSARCTVVRMVAAFVSSRWRDFAFARRLAV
jgi:hypothetical protein